MYQKHCAINGVVIKDTILIDPQFCLSSRQTLRPKYLLIFVTRYFVIIKYRKVCGVRDKHRRRHSRYLRSRESECKCIEPNSQWRSSLGGSTGLHWEMRRCSPDIDANAFHASIGTSSRRHHFDINSTGIESHISINISARSSF